MNVNKELLEKAKAAKSAEELLDMARKENIDMTEEEAAKAFAELHKNGELSDNELDNVSGGGCGDDSKKSDKPKFKVGDEVYYVHTVPGRHMGTRKVEAVILEVQEKYGAYYYKVTGDIFKTENELREIEHSEV